MRIGLKEKLYTLCNIYSVLFALPKKYIKNTIFYPLDSTRYTEFAYFLEYIRKYSISFKGKTVLDISSPFMLAYILAKDAHVTKTDINPEESRSIKPSKQLVFKQEDGTALTYADNSFDLVYSVSVIEHIYNGYIKTIQEMIRVCKPGGYIYLSFPVSKEHQEEWIENSIYSHQHTNEGKTFFQYRFSEKDVNEIIASFAGATVRSKDIYWERTPGLYDTMTRRMRKRPKNKYLEFAKMALLNAWYGFTILESTPHDFTHAKPLGNISIILQKN